MPPRTLRSREPGGSAGIKRVERAKEAWVDHCSCGADFLEIEPVEPAAPRRPSGAEVERAVRTLIAAAGDDPFREGLLDTPARVARAYKEWFAGYAVDPARLLDRLFTEAEDYEDMILLRSIPLVSTCEHHLAPITGHAHVAYRPNGRVVGISKLSRLVDAFARRLQLQERLTRQIARALDEALSPRGVAVVIEATHGCMATRGVNQHGISMVTKCWLGDFKADSGLRRELMESLGCGSARMAS
jgi:GTP cyclohydrolase I